MQMNEIVYYTRKLKRKSQINSAIKKKKVIQKKKVIENLQVCSIVVNNVLVIASLNEIGFYEKEKNSEKYCAVSVSEATLCLGLGRRKYSDYEIFLI